MACQHIKNVIKYQLQHRHALVTINFTRILSLWHPTSAHNRCSTKFPANRSTACTGAHSPPPLHTIPHPLLLYFFSPSGETPFPLPLPLSFLSHFVFPSSFLLTPSPSPSPFFIPPLHSLSPLHSPSPPPSSLPQSITVILSNTSLP